MNLEVAALSFEVSITTGRIGCHDEREESKVGCVGLSKV